MIDFHTGIVPAFLQTKSPGARRFVLSRYLACQTLTTKLPRINPQYPVTQPPNLIHLVADKDNSAATFGNLTHFAEALLLKLKVPNR